MRIANDNHRTIDIADCSDEEILMLARSGQMPAERAVEILTDRWKGQRLSLRLVDPTEYGDGVRVD